MSASDPLPPLGEVIARHGLRARKGLGQNFILDLNLTRRIARAAGDLAAHDVLEIGPGPGGLTRALLTEGARRVVAVELDRRCLPALAEIAAAWPGRLEVVHGDALALDAAALLHPPALIVANLPYNIGTELLARWLTPADWPPFWSGITVLLQREVAQRIAAAPGSRAYGRLSVLAQWRAEVRRLFDIPKQAFSPPPRVTSTLLALRPRPEPAFPADAGRLQQVTAAAFGQRRKMLRGALKGIMPDAAARLARLGIDPERRAESLSVAEFCAIARELDSLGAD
ncbi:MAG: 16S rRNA (adenine(1518)-N(6)/adenine(1519)-N(6))-dimethyltransferase RsmA [Alphaproteobacteria bacterium]|nr:MAG: 16S rRNA (adenine(1518)-N(6)/adenine(1519)-N(6))-dimethyltransferase RsmA [Alphaproteobacteria bacterium]